MNGKWRSLQSAALLRGKRKRVSWNSTKKFLSRIGAEQSLNDDKTPVLDERPPDRQYHDSARRTILSAPQNSHDVSKQDVRSPETQPTSSVRQFLPLNLQSVSTTSQEERRLLAKARLYGIISSRETLLGEANVGHTANIGSKMVDRPKHRNDLDFWRFILEVRQHYHGLEGLKAVWRGMVRRGQPVKLPLDNTLASDLMKTFIAAGATHDLPFLKQICIDCAQRRIFQPRAFVEVAKALLENNPQNILKARMLFHNRFNTTSDLLELFQTACNSEDEGALRAFCALLDRLPDFKIYHQIIPDLWLKQRPADAIMMHKQLIARRDFPRSFEDLVPYVQHLAITNESPTALISQLNAVEISYEAQIRRTYAHERAKIVGFSPETLNVVSGNIFGRKHGKLSDHTIARALATGSFSFNFVIETMHMFGIIEFGPLSIRQMAITSDNSEILKQRFAKLQDYQIDLGSSTYARVMKQLALSGRSDLIKQIAETDMHHEEFEDVDLQRRLLDQFAAKGDIRQLNQTLVILTHGKSNGLTEQEYVLNSLLRAALRAHDWDSVLQHVDTFRQRGLVVSQTVLEFMITSLVPHRHRSYDNSNYDIDSIGFVIGILQQLMVSGTHVRSRDWFRPIVTLGDSGRLDEVDSLLKWLAFWYIRKDDAETRLQSTPEDPFFSWSSLFTPGLQCILISWSFKASDWKNLWLSGDPDSAQHHQPWLRGARLLKSLRDEYNIKIDELAVRSTYRRCLKWMDSSILPGRARSNKHAAMARGTRMSDFFQSEIDLWGSEFVDDDLGGSTQGSSPISKTIWTVEDEAVAAALTESIQDVVTDTERKRLSK